MSSSFVRARPGQAFKLTAIPGAVILLGVDMAVWLPGGELCGWLSSFLPVILAIAVSVEALLTGARLVRADSLAAGLKPCRQYTLIRAIEFLGAVVGPGIFYFYIVGSNPLVTIGGSSWPELGFSLLYSVSVTGRVLCPMIYFVVALRTLTEYDQYRA